MSSPTNGSDNDDDDDGDGDVMLVADERGTVTEVDGSDVSDPVHGHGHAATGDDSDVIADDEVAAIPVANDDGPPSQRLAGNRPQRGGSVLSHTVFGDADKQLTSLGRSLIAKQVAQVLIAQPTNKDRVAQVLITQPTKKERQNMVTGAAAKPWLGLQHMDDTMRELFTPAEHKEINGILASGGAVEILLEDVPANATIIDTLTIRNIKPNGPKKGQAKVRVCLHGGQMLEGEHYERSHSPTICFVSLRTLIGVAAATGRKIRGGDFGQAYLNADGKMVYGYPPKSARQYDENGKRLIWAIPKALYGGKASGRYWYVHLRAWFIKEGFTPSEWDPCVFIRGDYIIGVYVDDLVHVYSDDTEYDALVAKFKAEFNQYDDLGPLTEIFNAEVHQSPAHITLTQTRFIESLCAAHGIDPSVRCKVPALQELPELVRQAKSMDAEHLDAKDHADYRAIVGAVLYLSVVCRPDVALAVGLLSRCLESPTEKTMVAARRLLQYLITTKDLGIRYTKNVKLGLNGMVDSDWAVDKSTSGYVYFLAQAALAWLSKKQVSIALSSTEAEIMAASLAALEAVFLRGLLKNVGSAQPDPTELAIDNSGAVALSRDYISNGKTKHIERRHLKVRELVEEAVVSTSHIPTADNVADILTKPLGYKRFEKLRKLLMNHA